MELFYRKVGEGRKNLIILHGLFGSSDNWQTLALRFGEEYSVYLVDLRNHGRSPKSDDFSYDLMAQDVKELVNNLGLSNYILMGHSMGGKVAIQFANQYADESLSKLIVVDIGIKSYPMHHDKILEGLMAINPGELKSRKEADKIMDHYVPEFMVKQFLLKNLYRKKEGSGYDWRINVPVLNREIHNIIEELPISVIDIPTLFIRGGKSNYILPEDYDNLHSKFSNMDIESIENSGHWIHAESPDQFYDLVTGFID